MCAMIPTQSTGINTQRKNLSVYQERSTDSQGMHREQNGPSAAVICGPEFSFWAAGLEFWALSHRRCGRGSSAVPAGSLCAPCGGTT